MKFGVVMHIRLFKPTGQKKIRTLKSKMVDGHHFENEKSIFTPLDEKY